MAVPNTTSSIAMALAGKTASVDIPKPRSAFARDGDTSRHPALLPTPPNSISPTLPPQAFKRRENLPGSPPFATSQFDSDLDIGDAAQRAVSRTQHLSPEDVDSAGALTPEMLAQYHLPGIMLQHGPLAIRHIMGYLTTSVPGFSRIAPAKARRLVVAALESRGNYDPGSGAEGEIIFDKVGWGRWDARRRGEPLRDPQHPNLSPPPSLSNSYPRNAMQIPVKRDSSQPYGSSVTGDSAVFSYTERDYGVPDVNMLEDEADKMSLDGDERGYCSSSAVPDDDIPDEDWGEEDVTDEEDWAQIGAAALRARSLNGGGGFVHGKHPSARIRGGGPASSSLAKSAPQKMPIQQLGFSLPDGMLNDREERAAVEALLRLGSM